MELAPQFVPPSPPMVFWNGPDEEKEQIAHILRQNLLDMQRSSRQLAAAVALFQFASQEPKTRDCLFYDWMTCAGRDGAFAIRNFAVALHSVRRMIGKIPEWILIVDKASLKESEKIFNEYFPFAHNMRHSVAHPEYYSDPNKNMSISGNLDVPGYKMTNCQSISIREAITNDIFAATIDGTYVYYQLSPQTILNLNRVCKQAFDALAAIGQI